MRNLPHLPLVFEAFPLRVGVLDLVESIGCGPVRRFAGDSVACALKVAAESPPRKRRAGR